MQIRFGLVALLSTVLNVQGMGKNVPRSCSLSTSSSRVFCRLGIRGPGTTGDRLCKASSGGDKPGALVAMFLELQDMGESFPLSLGQGWMMLKLFVPARAVSRL